MKLTTLIVFASLGLATAAHAEPTVSDLHPTAGWSTQVRYEDTTTSSDTGPVLGMSGFQVGIGKRITDDWYLGGTAELQLGDNNSDVENGFTTSLRAGGEARYIFHQGESSISHEDGSDPTTVPRFDWIGVRGGVQSVSGTHGSFGELEIGGDAWLSKTTQLGLFVAAGVNVEPPDAYGIPQVFDPKTDEPRSDRSDSTSMAISPYVSFGAQLAFG